VREAFLQDIRDNPDDDTPRLVFADWLDDNGDPQRAEFIRVQCALARMSDDHPRRDEFGAREQELLEANALHWTEGAFLAWLEHGEQDCPIQEEHSVCEAFAEAARLRLAMSDPADAERLEERLWLLGEQRKLPELFAWELRRPFFTEWEFERGFLHDVAIEEVLFYLFAPALRDLGMVRELTLLADEMEPEIGDDVIRRLIDHLGEPPLLALHLGTTTTNDEEGIKELVNWPGTVASTTAEPGLRRRLSRRLRPALHRGVAVPEEPGASPVAVQRRLHRRGHRDAAEFAEPAALEKGSVVLRRSRPQHLRADPLSGAVRRVTS
jgi:uncharacterized protein (TIGR02996 family)